jgi:GH15 family glucan-1,4-alpha-glucosidase
MYVVFGRSRLAECELDHLDGYAGSRPVRIGNGAYDQLQLDVYGGVIAAAAEYVDGGGRLGGGRLQRDQVALLAGFADVVCGLWAEPDHGIWEMRGARRQFTFSKLMCWVAIDRLLALDRAEKLGIDAPRLERTRASIAEAIESRGYNDAVGSYASELGGDRVDASLLLMPSLGYRDAGDPRHAATFARTEARLGQGGLFYRYEPDYDGERSPEGAFGICSFWAVENLARRGRVEQAEHYFARLLEAANDVGLYAEEIEPRTGAALGNFPQAFTHVGLINAALAIELARASRRDAA